MVRRGRPRPAGKDCGDRNWQEIHAARASRVYCIRDEYLNTPAPTLLHGLEALAFAIHPELFPQHGRNPSDYSRSFFHSRESRALS